MLGHLSLVPTAGSGELAYRLALCTLPLLILQLWQYARSDLLVMLKWPIPGRVAVCSFLLASLLVFGVRESIEFIYFQF